MAKVVTAKTITTKFTTIQKSTVTTIFAIDQKLAVVTAHGPHQLIAQLTIHHGTTIHTIFTTINNIAVITILIRSEWVTNSECEVKMIAINRIIARDKPFPFRQ